MRLWPPALLACLALVTPLRAEPDAEVQAAIRRAIQSGADGEVLSILADRLAGGLTLPAPPADVPATATEAVKVRRDGIQAALTQLSILSGGNGHLALQLAQGREREAIHLLAGTARLADLVAADDLLRQKGPIWHLSRPLVVWPGAALVLFPGEILEMDTAAGAFLLSFGDVTLTGATLRGDAGRNPVSATFRPFLLISGQGSFQARDASFQNLGFPGPVAFRGVAVIAAGLMRAEHPPTIRDSRFDGVLGLHLEGADGAVLIGNRVTAAGAAAVSIKDARKLTLAGNRIEDTGAGAGIRLSGKLEEVALLANSVRSGDRNGVQIDGTTLGLSLRGNVVSGNAGAGISIGQAACVAVQGNIIAGNGTAGLRLNRSGLARIADNAVLGNGSSGIEVAAQAGLGPVVLTDNLLSGNREGLRAAGLGEVRLDGNDLSDQTPRQFAGDFAPWLGPYLSAGHALVIPAAAGALPGAAPLCQTE